jgi:quercetin dioxygenase-like cupin family protein
MHFMASAADVKPTPAYNSNSTGYTRAAMIDHRVGSVHTGFGLCSLRSGGSIDVHIHSFEEGFYVLEGHPKIVFDGVAYSLEPGSCGVVPVGVPHAWIGPDKGTAKWLDMLAPQPKDDTGPQDTFFIAPLSDYKVGALDIRDPRTRNFFYMGEDDINVDRLKIGARKDAPQVSASMNTALLAYSGIAVKMLVDQRLDAQLMTMFMVDYQPGGIAQPHDHPLEETYYMLEGEVEAWADGKKYILKPGDIFWTGVGCVHAFYNRTDKTCRWLETSSPQPPARHGYRFSRDWEYLAEKLKGQVQS